MEGNPFVPETAVSCNHCQTRGCSARKEFIRFGKKRYGSEVAKKKFSSYFIVFSRSFLVDSDGRSGFLTRGNSKAQNHWAAFRRGCL
jgi:hypothetical protein